MIVQRPNPDSALGMQSSKQSTTKDLNDRSEFTPLEHDLLKNGGNGNQNAILVDDANMADGNGYPSRQKYDTFGQVKEAT